MHPSRPVRLLLPFLLLLLAAPLASQETSVHPGINDSFQDPDPETFANIFESESREIYAHRHDILEALELEKGMDVADVGAGTGFFSLMMAREVGPEGTVYAVDIAENFLEHIAKLAGEHALRNVETVHCTQKSTELPPSSVDLVFVSDTYHHFEFPALTLASIHEALRPEGELVVIDFERVEGVHSDWTLDHVRAGKGTVTDEIKNAGFDLVEEVDLMETQYVLRFEKRD